MTNAIDLNDFPSIERDTAVDVILREGSTLRLRAPEQADADTLVRFFAELSDQSLYRRFHGHPSVDARLVAPNLDPEWAERGALLGAVATDDGERVVALASYMRLREREAAEVAFAVADDYQGRGIGTRLLEQLAARAAEQGIERFVAEVIAVNRPMLRVFSEAGFTVSRTFAGGVVEVTFPIAATADYATHVAARDHTAVAASLRSFFEPRSVAVLGASPRRGTIGGELFRNILAGDFSRCQLPDQPRRRRCRRCARLSRRSKTYRTRSTLPSSAFPPLLSSTLQSRRWTKGCVRCSSSRPASPRSAPKEPRASASCSPSSARMAPV